MNRFRARALPTGRWAVEWWSDGEFVGDTPGTYATEFEADFADSLLVQSNVDIDPDPPQIAGSQRGSGRIRIGIYSLPGCCGPLR